MASSADTITAGWRPRKNSPIHLRSHTQAVTVGLVNNMPDAEFLNTESQFRALLARTSAAAGIPVRLRLFALPDLPRSAAVTEYLEAVYESFLCIPDGTLDALIVTGMEPKAASFEDETYWDDFVRLVAWAADHTVSAIWSCLAAHGCVFRLNGIRRQPYLRKLTGVFRCEWASPCETFFAAAPAWRVPHSRHNTLPESELARHGYQIWSHSRRTGPDVFVRQVGSLFVFLQGHPEYDAMALFREYRRDVGRFLRGKSDRYPDLPRDYLADPAAEALLGFRHRAKAKLDAGLLSGFPDVTESMVLHRWHDSAQQFYCHWLRYVAHQRDLAAEYRQRPTAAHAAREKIHNEAVRQ